MASDKTTFIYILELEQNKYYIGKTTNLNFRLENHFNNTGSWWTKNFKPIRLIEQFECKDEFDEDKYTLKYMKEKGIENVRGGSFCEIRLSYDNIHTIEKMLKSSTNSCFKCGGNGHFIKDCGVSNLNNDIVLPIVNIPRISKSTIRGIDVRKKNIFNLQSNEDLQILYMDSNKFEDDFNITNNVFIGVTNKRIFKIENNNTYNIYLKDINYCSHQKNSMFHWDKILCHLKNDTTDTIGIRYSVTTLFFVNYINDMIRNNIC